MAYVGKNFREKIKQYFKDYDYCLRHWLYCCNHPDMVSSEYFIKCQRRYYDMRRLMETL